MMNPFPAVIEQAIIDRYNKLPVATICDGMLKLGIPNSGSMDQGIKPICNKMRMTGTAMTVETHNGDNLPIHIATYARHNPGYIMAIDGKSYRNAAYIGELVVGTAKAVGFIGIVVDGYSRDVLGNIELGLPVFSRGVIPAGPIKKDQGNINTPIQCGGIVINPGDLIAGDSDGVCVVPRDRIAEVLEAAEAKVAYEEERIKTIAAYNEAKKNGKPLPNLAPDWIKEYI